MFSLTRTGPALLAALLSLALGPTAHAQYNIPMPAYGQQLTNLANANVAFGKHMDALAWQQSWQGVAG